MERNEAIALGLRKFNTGRACRHGHYADRYVDSGSCCECINGESKRGNSREVREQAAQLVDLNLRAHESDFPLLRDTAIGMTLARLPALNPVHVVPNTPPTKREAGTAMFRFRVHTDDAAFMFELAKTLVSSHKAVVLMTEADRLRYALGQAETTPSNMPEWTFK